MESKLSSYVTPITLALFGAVGVTGGLMFFHLSHAVEAAHGWLGWAFAGMGLVHVLRNRAAIAGWLREPGRIGAVLGTLAVAGALVAFLPGEGHGRRGPPGEELALADSDEDRPLRGRRHEGRGAGPGHEDRALDEADRRGPPEEGRRGGGHRRGGGERGEGWGRPERGQGWRGAPEAEAAPATEAVPATSPAD